MKSFARTDLSNSLCAFRVLRSTLCKCETGRGGGTGGRLSEGAGPRFRRGVFLLSETVRRREENVGRRERERVSACDLWTGRGERVTELGSGSRDRLNGVKIISVAKSQTRKFRGKRGFGELRVTRAHMYYVCLEISRLPSPRENQ